MKRTRLGKPLLVAPSGGHRRTSATRLRVDRRLLELGGGAACLGRGPLGRASPRVSLGSEPMGPRRRGLAVARRALGSPLIAGLAKTNVAPIRRILVQAARG